MPWPNVDEEPDALLGAVDTGMALAIAPLLLGRGQRHSDLPGYCVTEERKVVTP